MFLKQKSTELRRLTGQLHEWLTQKAWTEVLTTAEAVLELAPGHTVASQARQRAWQAVGMQATQVPSDSRHRRHKRLVRSMQSTHAWTASSKVDTWAMHSDSILRETSKRFVAWIDDVGGYLICLGDEVILGQPTGSGGAEIPILADLSRRHATIHRERESYIITPIHQVRVDGTELKGPVVLKNNTLIELGESVRLRFRQPHALSSTAVLTLESHHKTEPAVDSIVLMSESCVLGAQPQSHISCRGWTDDLVLFRRGEDLQFRTAASVAVSNSDEDGKPAPKSTTTGGVITHNTRIDGENFALSFEEV